MKLLKSIHNTTNIIKKPGSTIDLLAKLEAELKLAEDLGIPSENLKESHRVASDMEEMVAQVS